MIKVLYFGLEPETIQILNSDKEIQLLGAAQIEYIDRISFNPINLLFYTLYKIRIANKMKILEFPLRCLCRLLKDFTTGSFNKYNEYIIYLSDKAITVFDPDNTEKLSKTKPDLFVVNVWDMLKKSQLSIPKFGCLNLHPSKLPQYRGAVPTLYALKNGDSETALTYMILDTGLDNGRILSQIRIDISETDTALDLEEKIQTITNKTITDTIKRYIKGEMTPLKQDDAKASYTAKYQEYRQIRPREEKTPDIINKVELYPYLEPNDFCFVKIANRNIYIKRVRKQNSRLIPKLHINKDLSCILFFDISFIDSMFIMLSDKNARINL